MFNFAGNVKNFTNNFEEVNNYNLKDSFKNIKYMCVHLKMLS